MYQRVLFLTAILFTLASTTPIAAQQSEATKRLLERNKMFKPSIIQVADNVYTAIGYQVSANSMIIGDDGIIIIDPGQIMPGAKKVREAFEKITDKPVVAIIYTHAHGDHYNAGGAFVDPDKEVQIWARSNFEIEQRELRQSGFNGGFRPSNTQGFDLLPEQKIGIGIAIPPERRPQGNIMQDGMANRPARPNRPPGRLAPTHTFPEPRKNIEIAGIKLELVAAPGETKDQLYVWLPEQQVVFAGDNFYQSWPNVYPLRGTARRSTRDWIASIDKMVQEKPLHVVGGHTTPMLNNAVEVLTNYRDALQWVHDKTLEGAKKYMTPDELVATIALPDHLANLDYLADYYGTIEGTIRDIYAQDLGWFDGNPLTLHRESPKRQAQRMADLVGSVDQLLQKAKEALKADDPLGAAQLAHHVIQLRPKDPEPKLIMADALAIIGERTLNAPVRNYTISSSNRLRKQAQQ